MKRLIAVLSALVVVSAGLSGCIVVPVHPYHYYHYGY